MLLSSLGDSVGVFLCCWYAVVVLLLLFVESFSSDILQLLDIFLAKLVQNYRSNLKSDCLFVVLDLLDSVVWFRYNFGFWNMF